MPPQPPTSGEYLFLVHKKLGYQWVLPSEFAGSLEPEGFSYFRSQGETVLGTTWISFLPVSERSTDLLMLRELLQDKVRGLEDAVATFAPDGVVSFRVKGLNEGKDFYGDPVTLAELELELYPVFRRTPLSVLQWAARVLGNTTSRLEQIPQGKESLKFRLFIALGKLHDYRGVWVVGNGGKGIVTAVWVGSPEGEESPSRWDMVARPFALLHPLTTRFASLVEESQEFPSPVTFPEVALLLVGDATGNIQGQEIIRVKEGLAAIFRSFAKQPAIIYVGFVRSCEDLILASSPGADPFTSSRSANFLQLVEDELAFLWSTPCAGNRLFWSGIRAARKQGGVTWQRAKERWIIWMTEGEDTSPCLNAEFGNSCADEGQFETALRSDGVLPFGVGYVEMACSRNDATVATGNRAGDVKSLVERLGGSFFEYCVNWSPALAETLLGRLQGLVGNRLSHTPFPFTLKVFYGDAPLYPDPHTGYVYVVSNRSLILGDSLSFGFPLKVHYKTMLEPSLP